MKKLLLHGVVFLMTLQVMGQMRVIEDSECQDIGKYGKSVFTVRKCSDRIAFFYRDWNYSYAIDYKVFLVEPYDIKDFYGLIVKGFEDQETIKIELDPNNRLVIDFVRSLGRPYFRITHYNGSISGQSGYMPESKTIEMFEDILASIE